MVADWFELARLAKMLLSVAWLQGHYIIDAAGHPNNLSNCEGLRGKGVLGWGWVAGWDIDLMTVHAFLGK